MSEFWQVAVSVAGLGGIGCFIFWSLMRYLIPKTQGHPLNQKQTYVLTIISIAIAFLALVVILATYLFSRWMNNQAAIVSYSRIINITQENNELALNSAIEASKNYDLDNAKLYSLKSKLTTNCKTLLETVKASDLVAASTARKNYNDTVDLSSAVIEKVFAEIPEKQALFTAMQHANNLRWLMAYEKARLDDSLNERIAEKEGRKNDKPSEVAKLFPPVPKKILAKQIVPPNGEATK